MEEMDVDGNGYVELPEFEAWWSRHGGDLETHRDRAFTLVFEGGLELLRGGGHIVAAQMWQVKWLWALGTRRQPVEMVAPAGVSM